MSREHRKLWIQKGILHLMYYNATLHYVQHLRYRYLWSNTAIVAMLQHIFSMHFPLDWDNNYSLHLTQKVHISATNASGVEWRQYMCKTNKQTNKHAKPSTTGILNHEHHCVNKKLWMFNIQHVSFIEGDTHMRLNLFSDIHVHRSVLQLLALVIPLTSWHSPCTVDMICVLKNRASSNYRELLNWKWHVSIYLSIYMDAVTLPR